MNKTIESPHISGAWLCLLNYLKYARLVNPRGLPCREYEGTVIRVNDLRCNILVHPKRKLNYRFLVAEWLWIAFGRNDVATLARYNPELGKFSDDGLTFAGAYGPRLAPQWDWVYEKLKADPQTRQAICSIWTPTPGPSKDVPCTLNFQFLLRDGQLNAIVNMRSSDAWLGLPYDFFTFSQLTNSLAGRLGVVPGWLQLNLGSSHLYEADREKALAVLADYTSGETVRSPSLPGPPHSEVEATLTKAWLPPGTYLGSPWFYYEKALQVHNSADALEALRHVAPKP